MEYTTSDQAHFPPFFAELLLPASAFDPAAVDLSYVVREVYRMGGRFLVLSKPTEEKHPTPWRGWKQIRRPSPETVLDKAAAGHPLGTQPSSFGCTVIDVDYQSDPLYWARVVRLAWICLGICPVMVVPSNRPSRLHIWFHALTPSQTSPGELEHHYPFHEPMWSGDRICSNYVRVWHPGIYPHLLERLRTAPVTPMPELRHARFAPAAVMARQMRASMKAAEQAAERAPSPPEAPGAVDGALALAVSPQQSPSPRAPKRWLHSVSPVHVYEGVRNDTLFKLLKGWAGINLVLYREWDLWFDAAHARAHRFVDDFDCPPEKPQKIRSTAWSVANYYWTGGKAGTRSVWVESRKADNRKSQAVRKATAIGRHEPIQALLDSGATQAEAAQKLGVSISTVERAVRQIRKAKAKAKA